MIIKPHTPIYEEDSGFLGGSGGSGDTGGNNQEVTIPDNFIQALPEDLRNDPSLKDYKPGKEGLEGIVKSFINSQKMIGKDKIVLPSEKSTEDEWNEFYNKIGRPESPDGYELSIPELSNVKLDEDQTKKVLEKWKERFHKIGVQKDKANDIVNWFYSDIDADTKAFNDNVEANAIEAKEQLKKEWGSDFDTNVHIANNTALKFGGQEFSDYLAESGLGNDLKIVKVFASIGKALLDDSLGDYKGDLLSSPSTRAAQELESLKGDKDFINSVTDRTHPSHKINKAKWAELHQQAFS